MYVFLGLFAFISTLISHCNLIAYVRLVAVFIDLHLTPQLKFRRNIIHTSKYLCVVVLH